MQEWQNIFAPAISLLRFSSWAPALQIAGHLASATSEAAGDLAPTLSNDEKKITPEIDLQRTLAMPVADGAPDCLIECLAAIKAMQQSLPWYGSGRAGSAAYCQLAGPGSFFGPDRIRFGLFLLPENFHYPNHVHGADEIYVPLAGACSWSISGAGYLEKMPSEPVEIPSMTEHALKTGSSPGLMLWGWIGELGLERYRFT